MGMFDLTPRALTLLRVQKNLQQKELSERSGVGRAAISRYESGKASPSLENLGRLLQALEVGPMDFAETLDRLRHNEVEAPSSRRLPRKTPEDNGAPGAYLVLDLAEFPVSDPQEIEKAVESARELNQQVRRMEEMRKKSSTGA
jgi:transcriptional regulator with XRE-family HTH domain